MTTANGNKPKRIEHTSTSKMYNPMHLIIKHNDSTLLKIAKLLLPSGPRFKSLWSHRYLIRKGLRFLGAYLDWSISDYQMTTVNGN